MATDRSADFLFTTPAYYTFAVFTRDARGVVFFRWTPAQKMTWAQMHEKRMSFPFSQPVMTYYWNGSRWINYKPANSVEFAGVSIGALERRSPLPPGRYWQDIFAKQADAWNAWLGPALASGAVTIEKVEHFNADPLHDGRWLPGGPTGDLETIGDRTWVLFNVVNPIAWPATKLGFPTIADESVQQSSDTAQNPPGPTPGEEIKDALLDNVVKPAMWIGGGYLLLKLLLGRK